MITPPCRWACRGRGDVLCSRLHSLPRNPGLSNSSPPTPQVKCVDVDFCRMEGVQEAILGSFHHPLPTPALAFHGQVLGLGPAPFLSHQAWVSLSRHLAEGL